MQFTLASIVLGAVSLAAAQGVPAGIAPSSPPPPGCSTTYPGFFEITVVLPAAKKRDVAERSIQRRAACGGSGTLVASLTGGVLTDAVGRIGAIVANRQFQFDGPPAQTGSIYTGGWSVCGNSSLAIGGSAVFYQCLSGTFYNLYDQSTGAQCAPIEIDVIPCDVTTGAATQVTDGQVQASSATTKVTQISDGQIQASSAATKVTQISDGQIQVTSAGPKVTQISDGQIQATSAGPKVTQISDGQIQATSAGPKVSQISDGQIQATSAGPKVTQISDGQIQVTSAAPKVTQIPDGQVQVSSAISRPLVSQYTDGQLQVVPTVTAKPIVVSQITDGQIQAPTTLATVPVVTQITDGQIQAPNATASATQSIVTGAAVHKTVGASLMAGVVAVAAFAML